MNTAQFSSFVQHPEKLDSTSIPLLSELIKEYPYFQTGQILLAKNLFNEKNIRYNAQLKIAAAYSTDRKRLYELINGLIVQEIQVQPFIPKEEPIVHKIERKEIQVEKVEQKVVPIAIAIKPVEEVIKEKPVEKKSEINPEEKHTFLEWLHLSTIHSVSATPIVRKKKALSENDEAIEKFLKTEPKISKPPKAEFFSPLTMAKQSVVEDEELVTETLANIYEKQGNFEKAIKAFEKLSLKYPGKSRSFAARIEKLKEQLNQQ